jgi:hypothetical protein
MEHRAMLQGKERVDSSRAMLGALAECKPDQAKIPKRKLASNRSLVILCDLILE